MSELIGKVISGRYRVESFLGKGGMAEVYKVWDTERNVHLAMKILYADLAEDRVFLRRFKREAQTLATLQHPNIVRFYGLEQDDDLVFMLMDYVDGTTLRKEIFQAKAALSLERIQEIMRSVCAALYYAHKSGFVHCDVKPANIMIHSNGIVYVSDFGISRMTEASTATMVGAGTPAYMSPEQIKGDDPAPQVDIYALGIVLFEMLTGGERPFTGENAKTTGTTSEKVRWEQLRMAAPPPSSYNLAIAPSMDAIVLKCLDKSPTNRYLSAMDLYGDLVTLDSIPPQTKPVQPPKPEPAIFTPNPSLDAVKLQENVIKPQNTKNNRQLMRIGAVVVVLLCLAMIIAGKIMFDTNKYLVGLIPPISTLTQTHIPSTPTKTRIPSTPSQTPRPTATPNIVQTQNYDDIFSQVQKFKSEGLIPSTDGKYDVLDDYTETFAQMGYLTYTYYNDFEVEYFVYKAHVRWSTAGDTNQTSGCGVVFGVNPNGNQNDYYGVVLDKSRIYFSVTRSGYYYDLGKTRGTGKLKFGNPAEADFLLLVYDYKAYVYVNGEFIGEYTLSTEKALKGNFGYGIISGTNRDYGTRCEISNSRIWKLDR